MQCSSKAFLATFALGLLILVFGQLSTAGSQPVSIEDKALTYVKNVLPLDFARYNTSVRSYELPDSPNATYRTDSVNFMLNSTDSTESLLVVNCLFRDGVQYTCDMRVLNGLPIYSKSYLNLVEATRDVIRKHQSQTGVDSTELLRTLDMVDSAEEFRTATQGNITLTVTLGHVPTGLKMVNGSLHVDGTKTIGVTSFRWNQMIDEVDQVFFLISFDNGIFHGLRDERILYKVEKGEGIALQPEPTTSSLVLIAAGLPSGAVVGVGLAFYFKKRKASAKTKTHNLLR
jgi:hypothetical protein